jgi:3-hydroxyacyl-[acyl-carrier-protein] dehydratase
VRRGPSLRFRDVELPRERVAALLPHRPPLMLVDGVTGLGVGRLALRARLRITGDEPVLAGHFPDSPVWPGAYTIEGLAQSCALLGALVAHGELVPDAHDATTGAALDESALPAHGEPRLAAVNVKLVAPVPVPGVLGYEVCLAHVVGPVLRFDVEAYGGKDTVASGTLSVAWAAGGDT